MPGIHSPLISSGLVPSGAGAQGPGHQGRFISLCLSLLVLAVRIAPQSAHPHQLLLPEAGRRPREEEDPSQPPQPCRGLQLCSGAFQGPNLTTPQGLGFLDKQVYGQRHHWGGVVSAVYRGGFL